jgi:hypothetical protein
MTTAPLPLSGAGAPAAPALEYDSPREQPTGLHVERTDGDLTVTVYPPKVRHDVKRAVVNALVWGTVALILFWAPILLVEFKSVSAAATPLIILLVVNLPVEVVIGIGIVLWFRAEVRIDVTGDAVVVTVRGFRLYYQDAFCRGDIVAVNHSFFGLRLNRRDRRRGDWMPIGIRSERQQVCRLLREELGL